MADLTSIFGSGGFNAEAHVVTSDFEPLVPGKYLVQVLSTEMKYTKDGNGQYLELVFCVAEEGKYKGRKLWERLNLVNSSAKAVQIASDRFSEICCSCGLPTIDETNHLVGRICVASVAVDKDGYNKMNKYTSMEGPNSAVALPVAVHTLPEEPPQQPAAVATQPVAAAQPPAQQMTQAQPQTQQPAAQPPEQQFPWK